MISFLNEEFVKARRCIPASYVISHHEQAEQELTLAFYHCHVDAHENQAYAGALLYQQPS